MRTLSAYRLVDVLAALITAAGWRPVSGVIGHDLILLTFRRQPLRDRAAEHDLSGPDDHG